MVGGIEAAADAITGGLLARTVEPEAGEGVTIQESPACLNCKTALVGNHCHACGQKAHVHRTLRAFGHEIAHGVFHFEGKVWRTLPMLAWRPGELTRRYIHGERARFVSPLALFLFSIFLLFAVFGRVTHVLEIGVDSKPKSAAAAKAGITKERKAAEAQLAVAQAERAKLLSAHEPTEDADSDIADAKAELKDISAESTTASRDWDFDYDHGRKAFSANTGWKALDDAVNDANKNPALVLYKLKSSAYKFSWALIPLSVPFLWLLFFWRRNLPLYDHTVFVTYSICFMTLWATVLALVYSVGLTGGWLIALGVLVPLWHLYRQMKDAYQLGRVAALVRTSLLLFLIASVIVPLFLAALLVLGVLG
jgi:Protein of unknown function (DUF3667)